jgi:hypothetical protein
VLNLQGAGLNAQNKNHLAVTADLSSATWNTVASHEVFTVTGLVRMRMWVECTETVQDAANAADIQFGVEGATDAFIAATGAAGKGGSTLSANELWYDTSPTTVYDTAANVIKDYVVNGLDVGYEITGEALTEGTLVFHCVWEALNSSGNVVAGAGGTL